MHKYTSKVIIRKDVVRKDGTSPIYLQVFINGRQKKIPLQMFVKQSQFKEGGLIVLRKEQKREEALNGRLHKVKERVEKIFSDAHLLDQVLTVEQFLYEFEKKHMRGDMIAWIGEQIELAKEDKGTGTIKNYKKLYNRLKAWRRKMAFNQVDDRLIDAWQRHLKGRNYGVNTIADYHKNLKKFINLAIRQKKMFANPYKNFRIQRAKAYRVYLIPDEVTTLWRIYQSGNLNANLQRVMRWFLFMSFTGIRPGDLIDLEEKNIINKKLIFCPNKTENSKLFLSVPLSRYAQQLIADGEGRGHQLFRCEIAENINPPLKTIAVLAGIDKHLTNYVGRHTFATTFLSSGGKVTVLQTLLGHSKIETTMEYVHILEEDKVTQMKAFDDFWSFDNPQPAEAV